MTKIGDVNVPEDARYREGNHGEVDIFDVEHDVFVRVDKGDKIVRKDNGYTVEKAEDNVVTPAEEVFPEKGVETEKQDVEVVAPGEEDPKSDKTQVVDPEAK